MKVLVVYYSRTENTKLIAEAITQSLETDIEEIRDKKNRTGAFGFLISGYEALFKKPTDIEKAVETPEKYDLVIVGSPVWVGRLSSPVRTYLSLYGNKMKRVAFFATYGINSGKIFSQMEELSKSPVATLGVKAEEIESGEYAKKVERFASKIKSLFKVG